MIFKEFIKVIIMFLLLSHFLNGEENKSSIINAYGGFAGYSFNTHSADFNKLPEIPNCCPGFEEGTGSGFLIGLFAQKDFSYRLSMQLRAGFHLLDGDLTNEEKPIPILDKEGNEVSGEFKHFMNTQLGIISITPSLAYRIFDDLKINIGLNAGYLMIHNYEQYEQIVKPSDWGTFVGPNGENTGARKRFELNGSFSGTNSIQLFALGGISYELPLNKEKDMFLVPELSYSYGLTSILKDNDWKVNSLIAGLSFIYYLTPTPSEIIEPTIKDVNLFAYEDCYEVIGNTNDVIYGIFEINDIENNAINAGIGISIKAVAVTDNIEDVEIDFHLEEFLSTNMRPLLTYIFFDDNSDLLPTKYIRLNSSETKIFDEDSLINIGTLQTYYQILNIIAQRLKENPETKIKLTGCNSNAGAEKGNTALSQKRADNVANYLKSVWGIDSKRIQISSRNLPEKSSSVNDPMGIEENRRVEITCDNWEIIKPVITADTLLKATPQIIRFYPDVIAKNKINKYSMNIAHLKNDITIQEAESQVPTNIDWALNTNKQILQILSDPLEYALNVTDSKGNNVQSEWFKIPIKKTTIKKKQKEKLGDKRIDRYSLILFDYNSSELSADNAKIAEFIKKQVQGNSEVKITGFTDDMGEENYNRQLSELRAINLRDNLKFQNAYTRGLGESEKIYDNALPEGRFYSRTVEVIVETPIKW